MAKMKIYIVQEYAIHNYEKRWNDTHAFVHRENALAKLRDIKNQDMMPIVEEESLKITKDTETEFLAGREGNFSKESVSVRIIETVIGDYSTTE